jgi:hypothetical protein
MYPLLLSDAQLYFSFNIQLITGTQASMHVCTMLKEHLKLKDLKQSLRTTVVRSLRRIDTVFITGLKSPVTTIEPGTMKALRKYWFTEHLN